MRPLLYRASRVARTALFRLFTATSPAIAARCETNVVVTLNLRPDECVLNSNIAERGSAAEPYRIRLESNASAELQRYHGRDVLQLPQTIPQAAA